MVSYETSKVFTSNEVAPGSGSSLLSWASLSKVVVSKVRKIPEGCDSLALLSKIILMLLEF